MILDNYCYAKLRIYVTACNIMHSLHGVFFGKISFFELFDLVTMLRCSLKAAL